MLVLVLVRVYSHSLRPVAESGDLDRHSADYVGRRMRWSREEQRKSYVRTGRRMLNDRTGMAVVERGG